MKLGVTIAILIAAFVFYRPIVRLVLTPSETRAPWVEQLATFGTGLAVVDPEIAPIHRLDSVYQETYGSLVTQSNAQKRRLWETYASKKGHYGLLSRHCTVEGDWIYSWLLVEDGKLRFVHDRTRDGGAVDTHNLKGARLGFLHDHKFIEGQPGAEDSPLLVFELDTGGHYLKRFY